MAYFAKLFDLAGGVQLLYVADYNTETEEHPVRTLTKTEGVRTTFTVKGFKSKAAARHSVHSFTKTKAERVRAFLLKENLI